MAAQSGSEVVDRRRRQLLTVTAMTIAAAGTASLFPAPAPAAESDAIRPFLIDFPEADLVDLRRRLLATRWPDRETALDQSQGVQLAKLQELARYWGTDYD